MVEAWYAIFWLMIAVYVVLDGRTLGAGALRSVLSANAGERRQVLDAMGPEWSLYEVWLIGAGGVLLLAFPPALGIAFAGYYLALMMVLWLLILRGIAIELGRHFGNPLWTSFWDFVLAASCALLLVLFGAALGNVIRGAPLDEHGEFHMALFTDFRASGQVGLLDWYTVSVGVFALVALLAHGATHVMSKVAGPVRERARKIGARLWLASLAAAIVVAVGTRSVRPDLWPAFVGRPLSLVFLVVTAAGAGAVVYGFRSGRDLWAYVGSCTLISGIVGARAAAGFPEMFYSTLDPQRSISAHDVATSHHGLAVGLAWWLVAVPLVVLWHVLAARSFRGRVAPLEPPA